MEKLSEGLRTMKLEDGENVVMLYGARKKSDKWRSDHPHAGMWGKEIAYVLVPCSMPGRRAAAALQFDPTLQDRSDDASCVVMGSVEAISRLIRTGPRAFRARRPRAVSSAQARMLAEMGFKKR